MSSKKNFPITVISRMGYFACKSDKDLNVWEDKDFANISALQDLFIY